MESIQRRFALVVLLVLVTTFPALAQQTVSISDLIQHPAQYDGKVISATGTVTNYRERVSARGNAYTTFGLEGDGSSVSVFAWQHQGLHSGEQVRVIGTFAKVKHVGSYTFYNEIEAQRIATLAAIAGLTALCNDGTYSYAVHHQGACSHHGGVAVWYR